MSSTRSPRLSANHFRKINLDCALPKRHQRQPYIQGFAEDRRSSVQAANIIDLLLEYEGRYARRVRAPHGLRFR